MTTLPTDRSVVSTTLRVRYAETDAMGASTHTNYAWFEVGRSEFSRQMGADYRSWEHDGYPLLVTEVNCRHLAPTRYGDIVTVYTWVEELRSRMVTLGCQQRYRCSRRARHW